MEHISHRDPDGGTCPGKRCNNTPPPTSEEAATIQLFGWHRGTPSSEGVEAFV